MSDHTKYFKIEGEGDRADGFEKVTGKAKFTAEHQIPDLAYGVFVCSTIAKGTIKNLNDALALKAAGVLDVISFKNCPNIPGYNSLTAEGKKNNQEWRGLKVLNDNKVRFFGQPIALIVADSFQNATDAIKLVKADYEKEDF